MNEPPLPEGQYTPQGSDGLKSQRNWLRHPISALARSGWGRTIWIALTLWHTYAPAHLKSTSGPARADSEGREHLRIVLLDVEWNR
jgi:hypothetical protein